ncbi:hypothetical protein RchiOBHm_Chr6g0309271 [Rosa chinensis]|uniref:Uncharacterized protein n=1 Tax=Rosa chinensis TaxID=74649 RepID=A0A2P6Q0U3_ROSCH|nr:hypothetical protein RchiOBHm_Chr6g0309271 [Rosa chinensis]
MVVVETRGYLGLVHVNDVRLFHMLTLFCYHLTVVSDNQNHKRYQQHGFRCLLHLVQT